jgi:hypothetical protein
MHSTERLRARSYRFEDYEPDRFFKMKCLPLVFEDARRALGVILEDINEMKEYQIQFEAGQSLQESDATFI